MTRASALEGEFAEVCLPLTRDPDKTGSSLGALHNWLGDAALALLDIPRVFGALRGWGIKQ